MDKVDLEGYQFFASPSDRALLAEVLARLTALEERDRLREEENATLKEENRQLRAEVESLREENALERAYDRQRISKLEAPAPVLREETAAAHLDRLSSEMRRLNIKQTTVKDAARLLGVSKPLMKKLKPYLAADSRFVVMKDPHHKQRHLIRLTGM
jgi:predicted GNAT family acetyltransferase